MSYSPLDISNEKSAINFIDRVWKSEYCNRKPRIVFFAESNYGSQGAVNGYYQAIQAWAVAAGCDLYCVLEDTAKHDQTRPGFWLDSSKKHQMAVHMRKIAHNNRLAFHQPLLVGGDKSMATLFDQAEHYVRRPIREKQMASGTGMYDPSTISCEYTGKSGGRVDDQIIITQEVLLMLPRVFDGDARLSYLNTQMARVGHAMEHLQEVMPDQASIRALEFIRLGLPMTSYNQQRQ